MLWLVFIVMTVAVLALLLSPLLRKPAVTPPRVDYDVIVYRDQLAEVDKDVERGVLTSEQAEAARSEIYRRMLAAEDAEKPTGNVGKDGATFRSKLTFALIVLTVLPLSAGLMYVHFGSPELPGKPYASRQNDPDFVMTKDTEKLAAQLEDHPDAEGYKKLAGMYITLRRFDQVAEAYRKIIALNGGDAGTWSELGEVLAVANDGSISPESRAAFVKAVRLDPQDTRARFYLGLAEAQSGDPRRAVSIWKDLQQDSPPDAPYTAVLKDRIAALAKEGGFDPASVPPAPP